MRTICLVEYCLAGAEYSTPGKDDTKVVVFAPEKKLPVAREKTVSWLHV